MFCNEVPQNLGFEFLLRVNPVGRREDVVGEHETVAAHLEGKIVPERKKSKSHRS